MQKNKEHSQRDEISPITNKEEDKVPTSALTYDELYLKPHKCKIFARTDSYWNDSYGAQLDAQPNSKVIVFGLPKSGNTFLVSLLSQCLGLEIIDPLEQIGEKGVGMTHRPFSATIADRMDLVHGLALLRDLRDIIASFYDYSQTHFFRTARPEFQYTTIESFYYDWFLSRIDKCLRVEDYVAEYARVGVPVVRYEALIANPVGELSRIFHCLGLEVAEVRIQQTVQKLSFDNLKTQGLKFGQLEIPQTHFAVGRCNRYKHVLTPEVLDDIRTRYANFFTRWGYS